MTEDEFQYWLFDMDDALERFLEGLPKELQATLDYSPSSLDALEAWLLKRYGRTQDMRLSSEWALVDGSARYVGETIRKVLGGVWNIDMSDPHYAYYGLPQLSGFPMGGAPECPLTLVTAAVDRRTGTYMRTVLQNRMR